MVKFNGTTNCQPITVPFHGNNLYLVNKDNEPYVPMKPVVEGMGLVWGAQLVKLNHKFHSTVSEIDIVAADGKNRSMICLPLRKLPAWLYSIQPNKVKAEIRDKVIAYQEECDEVLWQYWSKGSVTKETVTKATKSYLPEFRHARAIKMVTQTADTICSRFPNLSLNSQQAIFASLVNPIAGENVVPLPMIENKTYSATEVGQRLGISATKVGSIANKHGLKVSKYGYYVLDKAKYSDKHVETFRYNDEAIQTIKSLA